MNRREAIQVIARWLQDELLVSYNGAASRELFAERDRPQNLYLLGSMGLASAVGLGLALGCPAKRVVIIDGDGNLLMGLGNLAQIGAAKPRNLMHLVLDNGVYATTGNQPTISASTDLGRLALTCGYAGAQSVSTATELGQTLQSWQNLAGPLLLRLLIDKQVLPPCPRIPLTAQKIGERFRFAVAELSAKKPPSG